jgi:predicted MFS family arabinose efflux permease
VALCGLAFGAVPVAWSTWLTRTVPDQAESAGGLLVAAIQLAITVGAAAGGAIFDLLDEAYRDSLAGATARAAV